jgi:hypothetical protein
VTTWWLSINKQATDLDLPSRLQSLADIKQVAGENLEIIRTGDICLCSGMDFKSPCSEIVTKILIAGANLVVMPPYEEDQPLIIMPGVEQIKLRQTSFSPVKVLDGDLRRTCGLDELVILYNQTFSSFPGIPAVVSAGNLPVVVRYQHRNTWGSFVFVTFLLGSSSARSLRHHRVAFLTGLEGWLGGTKLKGEPVIDTGKGIQDLRLMQIYPLLVLISACLPFEQSIGLENLNKVVRLIETRLGSAFPHIYTNFNWIDNLEKVHLVKRISDSSWEVQREFLLLEVSRLHLYAYIRRLQ